MGFFDTLASQVKNQITDGLGQQVGNRVDEIVRDANPLSKFNLNLGTGHIDSEFQINEFISNISKHGELAKADKFMVKFRIPAALGGHAAWSTVRELSLQCEISELPGRDIGMIEYRHYGFIRRIPHNNQYGQASFTFYCTGDMHEKKLFDTWLDMMVPASTGLVAYPMSDAGDYMYEVDIDINQYDVGGNLIYQATLVDAIPVSTSPLAQNWSDDSVLRLTVNFAFRKWASRALKGEVSLQEVETSNIDEIRRGDGTITAQEVIDWNTADSTR